MQAILIVCYYSNSEALNICHFYLFIYLFIHLFIYYLCVFIYLFIYSSCIQFSFYKLVLVLGAVLCGIQYKPIRYMALFAYHPFV